MALVANPAWAIENGWGYVWADQPTAASYTPNINYQFNSSYGATNTITHTGPGAYTVDFPNLDANGGTVLVTAYGGGNETCKVAGWAPSGSTAQVNVRCFSGNAPVNTSFTATFARPFNTSEPMAYVWAHDPSSASYTPSLTYQFNSMGAINSITRTGRGTYTVRLPGLGASAGHVQVTAYGSGSERCKVVKWYPSGPDQLVRVQCHTSAGSTVDTRYVMTYVQNINVVGSPNRGEPGTFTGYAWADQPTAASYTPNLPYQFNDSGFTNTITRIGVGHYQVNFPPTPYAALGRGGDVQVTAYGTGSSYCKVKYWTESDGVRVQCYNAAGAPADTKYTVTWLWSYLVG